MKKILSLLLLFVAAVSGAVAAEGFHTSGTKLFDANGNEFIMRGCNYSWAWQRGNEYSVIPAAKRIGCNAIRIQLSTGRKWQKCSKSDLERLIKLCEDNKLIAVFNTHDETGSNEYSDLENAANFWIEMKDVLNAHRKTVLVNISNEWFGRWESEGWADGYKKVIPKLRSAGILNTLVVDCAGWGQYPKSIFDRGREVAAADTKNNIVFSMHFYQDAAGSDYQVRSNIDNALNVGCPVLIGEFAYEHQGHTVAWQTILDYATEKKVGYLVWSWTGNGDGVEACDMFGGYDDSNWKPNGTNTVKGRNGIQQTARECSIYDPNGGQGGGEEPDPIIPTPGQSTVLWEGSVDFGAWKGMLEYKPGSAQWKNDQMGKLAKGDKLVFHFTGVATDEKAPGQIQLATFGLDSQWTWTVLVDADNIQGNEYTYTVTGTETDGYTDLEMLSTRGFAAKGQNATLVKVELKSVENGGSGDNPGGSSETVVDTPQFNISGWDVMYHLEKSRLGTLTSADKVRLYVSCGTGAEIQIAYKTPASDWTQYVDYAPISGSTYDLTMTDSGLLEGANHDGLYFKGHDYTIQKVSVIRQGQSGVEETTIFDNAAPVIDFDQPYEIYTLDGRRVSEMVPGHIYILRQGSTVLKQVAR